MRGMPVWATLLALEDDGELTTAVASAPAMGRRWWAGRGDGAFYRYRPGAGRCESRRSARSGMRRSVTAARVNGADRPVGGSAGADRAVAGGRAASATSGSTCWSPKGSPSSASDPTVTLWDFAAPMLIVQEAGGRFTDFTGLQTADGGSGLASNGAPARRRAVDPRALRSEGRLFGDDRADAEPEPGEPQRSATGADACRAKRCRWRRGCGRRRSMSSSASSGCWRRARRCGGRSRRAIRTR